MTHSFGSSCSGLAGLGCSHSVGSIPRSATTAWLSARLSLRYGDLAARFGLRASARRRLPRASASPLRRSIAELTTALDLDSRRDPLEVRRFKAETVAKLQQELARLKSLMADADPRGSKPEIP